jgi:hypothetical protein
MANYKIQVANNSDVDQAYFLLVEIPQVSGVEFTVFPTGYQQSPVVPSGGLVDMEINNAQFAICGTSPGIPLGPGVNLNINDARPVVIAPAGQPGPMLFLTIRNNAAVFEDRTATMNAPVAIQTDKAKLERTCKSSPFVVATLVRVKLSS